MAETTVCASFHAVSFAIYCYTFIWHFGKEAAKLPQAKGFGWFTQYLTSCTFFLHFATLCICVLSHILPQEEEWLSTLADDLSCVVFSITNVSNILFWFKYVLTLPPSPPTTTAPGSTEPFVLGAPPIWLILTLHLLSSIMATTDLALCNRTFSAQAWIVTRTFSVTYLAWMHICTWINKRYPYPFLNALPQPQSTLILATIAYIGIKIFFVIGTYYTRQ